MTNTDISLKGRLVFAVPGSMLKKWQGNFAKSFDDYKNMTDKQHLSKAKNMPVKFLKASGKGFFIEKEGYAIAIREQRKR